jgi:hypothetical protein
MEPRHAMTSARPAGSGGPPPLALWPLALGATGFACGFFGPIALVPEANQGPLLGIFLTGPGGVLLGLLAGIVARRTVRSPSAQWKTLAGLCVAGGLTILVGVLPPPERTAHLVEGEIRGCEPPATAAPAAIADWEKRVAQVTWSPPRAGWRQDVARMLRDDPGVVLEVSVLRSRDVYRNRKPWNAGTLFAEPWQESGTTQRYFADFAGTECPAYLALAPALYLPDWQRSRAWPPDRLPNFLGLQRLDAVPAEYRRFTGE